MEQKKGVLTLQLTKKQKEKQLQKFFLQQKEQYFAEIEQIDAYFPAAFYTQCIESTIADGYEMLILDYSNSNYLKAHLHIWNTQITEHFFKLAAIHHTIRMVRRYQKHIQWENIFPFLCRIFSLNENEQKMASILYQCACMNISRFSALFATTTTRYLFAETEICPPVMAFLLHFWYNSYHSFITSFTSYVPFRVRLEKASGT